VVIEGRMRDLILNEQCIVCTIRPELGSPVCILRHAAILVHDGKVESLTQSI